MDPRIRDVSPKRGPSTWDLLRDNGSKNPGRVASARAKYVGFFPWVRMVVNGDDEECEEEEEEDEVEGLKEKQMLNLKKKKM